MPSFNTLLILAIAVFMSLIPIIFDNRKEYDMRPDIVYIIQFWIELILGTFGFLLLGFMNTVFWITARVVETIANFMVYEEIFV